MTTTLPPAYQADDTFTALRPRLFGMAYRLSLRHL